MDEQELSFPLRGVDQSRAFVRSTPETTPSARNVRAFDDLEDRRRGGSRDGLARWLDDTVVAGSKIQGLGCVVSMGEAFVTGYYPFAWPGFVADPVTFGPIRPGGSGESSNPKKPPSITWTPGATSLFADEAFGGTHLDATAKNPQDSSALAGAFSYDPPSGTVFGSGSTRTVTATFTPTDTANFRTAQATYTFKKKKTPTYVDWAPSTEVANGTVLDGTILNAVGKNKDTAAVVAGAVTYDLWYFDGDGNRVNLDASGYALLSGQSPYYLNAFFTPDNTVRFETAKMEVVVTVDPPPVGGPPYTFKAFNTFATVLFGEVASEYVEVRDSANNLINSVAFGELNIGLYSTLIEGGYDAMHPLFGPITLNVADNSQPDGGGMGTWHYP